MERTHYDLQRLENRWAQDDTVIKDAPELPDGVIEVQFLGVPITTEVLGLDDLDMAILLHPDRTLPKGDATVEKPLLIRNGDPEVVPAELSEPEDGFKEPTGVRGGLMQGDDLAAAEVRGGTLRRNGDEAHGREFT